MTDSINSKIADREMVIKVGGSCICATFLATLISYLIATQIYHIPLPQTGIYIGSASGTFIAVVIIGVVTYLATRTYPEEKKEEDLEKSLQKSLNNSGEFCAITLCSVKDGVRTPDGQLYEREAIEKWIDLNGTNPKTRQPLSRIDLVSNTVVQRNIDSVNFRAYYIE